MSDGLKLELYPSLQKVEKIGRKSEVFLTLSKGRVKKRLLYIWYFDKTYSLNLSNLVFLAMI